MYILFKLGSVSVRFLLRTTQLKPPGWLPLFISLVIKYAYNRSNVFVMLVQRNIPGQSVNL
jgi:hypothetical protein